MLRRGTSRGSGLFTFASIACLLQLNQNKRYRLLYFNLGDAQIIKIDIQSTNEGKILMHVSLNCGEIG